MSEVLKYINIYIEETENILNFMKEDNIDEINNMFDKRQEILKHMENYDLKIYKKYIEDKLIPLENEIRILIQEKKQYYKCEIFKIGQQKNANKAYNNKFSNSNIFNKKV